MYKLMIVEDETWIRAGLVKYFNWRELGFTEITEAANGLDALEKAKAVKPDFILTDIRMPQMDGLQLIEKLREILPDCIFVILSGYEDFTYAKKAISLGVTSYLIKPLQYDESMTTIHECVDKMKQRKLERDKQEAIVAALEQTEKWKQEKQLKQLIENEFNKEEWEKYSTLFKLPTLTENYLTAVVSACPLNNGFSHWEELSEQIKSLWDQLSQEFLDCRVSSYTTNKKLYFFISSGSHSGLFEYVSTASRITLLQCMEADHLVYCGIGPAVTAQDKIQESMRTAENAIYYRFFKHEEYIFDSSKIVIAKKYSFPFNEDQKRILTKALEQADKSKIIGLMDQYHDEVRRHHKNASPDLFFAFIQEIISTCLRFVHKHGIDTKEIYDAKLFSFHFLDDFHSVQDLFEWLGEFIFTIGLNYKDQPNDTETQDTLIFTRIEAYILENIDKDISLNTVASIFFYNPAYLSRLFKNKLNKNYTTFITEIRINYAKKCLKNPSISVSAVGPLCGYQSYKHFVKTFKKMTGITPTDYRKRLGETG